MKGAGLDLIEGLEVRVGWASGLANRGGGLHHRKEYRFRDKWPAACGSEDRRGGYPPAGAAMRAGGALRWCCIEGQPCGGASCPVRGQGVVSTSLCSRPLVKP